MQFRLSNHDKEVCVSVYCQYWKKVVICWEVNHCQYLSSTGCFIGVFQHGFLLVTLRLVDCLSVVLWMKPTHRGRIRNQQQQHLKSILLFSWFMTCMHFEKKFSRVYCCDVAIKFTAREHAVVKKILLAALHFFHQPGSKTKLTSYNQSLCVCTMTTGISRTLVVQNRNEFDVIL